MDMVTARIAMIAYRRQLIALLEKIERDWQLGKYDPSQGGSDVIDAQQGTKTPDVIDLSLNTIDTELEKP